MPRRLPGRWRRGASAGRLPAASPVPWWIPRRPGAGLPPPDPPPGPRPPLPSGSGYSLPGHRHVFAPLLLPRQIRGGRQHPCCFRRRISGGWGWGFSAVPADPRGAAVPQFLPQAAAMAAGWWFSLVFSVVARRRLPPAALAESVAGLRAPFSPSPAGAAPAPAAMDMRLPSVSMAGRSGSRSDTPRDRAASSSGSSGPSTSRQLRNHPLPVPLIARCLLLVIADSISLS